MSEPVQIGISGRNHEKLRRLKDDGPFLEMQDAYRFGIALALARNAEPQELVKRDNLYAISTIDPEGTLAVAIRLLRPETDLPIYRLAEQLADWGVAELYRLAFDEAGIDFVDLLARSEEMAAAPIPAQ